MEEIKITYLIYRLDNQTPVMTVARNDEQLNELINIWTDRYDIAGTSQLMDDILFVLYVSKPVENVVQEDEEPTSYQA